jgi:hypothetical protein
MKALIKRIKEKILLAAIVCGLAFSGTQQCNAAYYDNYYQSYLYWLSAYNNTGYATYYWWSVAFYYYYLGGLYGDYFGYYYDSFGFKSTNYRRSITNAEYYYNLYASYGDYYARF